MFLGSNNVFVPTRGSRLFIGSWAPAGAQEGATQDPSWANWPDDWGGRPGDGKFYTSHTYISEVKVRSCARRMGYRGGASLTGLLHHARATGGRQITPHNEANDIVFPMTFDQPDGCTPKCACAHLRSCFARTLIPSTRSLAEPGGQCHRSWFSPGDPRGLEGLPAAMHPTRRGVLHEPSCEAP